MLMLKKYKKVLFKGVSSDGECNNNEFYTRGACLSETLKDNWNKEEAY